MACVSTYRSIEGISGEGQDAFWSRSMLWLTGLKKLTHIETSFAQNSKSITFTTGRSVKNHVRASVQLKVATVACTNTEEQAKVISKGIQAEWRARHTQPISVKIVCR